MLGISFSEFVVVGAVVFMTVGRKDLPKLAYSGGRLLGGVARQLRQSRSAMDDFAQKNQLDELQGQVQRDLKDLRAVREELQLNPMFRGRRMGPGEILEHVPPAGQPPGDPKVQNVHSTMDMGIPPVQTTVDTGISPVGTLGRNALPADSAKMLEIHDSPASTHSEPQHQAPTWRSDGINAGLNTEVMKGGADFLVAALKQEEVADHLRKAGHHPDWRSGDGHSK